MFYLLLIFLRYASNSSKQMKMFNRCKFIKESIKLWTISYILL